MPEFHVITIFPEFFQSPLAAGLLGKAIGKGLISVDFQNPRDYSSDPHRHVDDYPFGGGPGMIMRAQPIADALAALPEPGKILLMSPAGRQLTSTMARCFADEGHLTIICGRYEGMDARLFEALPIEEIAFGEAILNGGETAALAVIESVSRFVPGFLGKSESLDVESHSGGLLEYPQYTRPAAWEGRLVPPTLLSGNHQKIASWRRNMSLAKTLENRPDLLDSARLSRKDAETLAAMSRLRTGRNLSFCLVHAPVKLEKGRSGASSLTNLDAHDISRISSAYGMGPFFILTPLRDQLDLAERLISHWTTGPGSKTNPHRARALSLARPVADFASLAKQAESHYGVKPVYFAASAAWPAKGAAATCADVLETCKSRPVVILLGTAGGLDLKSLPVEFSHLRPVRFLDENHLSVRAAAAIIADRILKDYN